MKRLSFLLTIVLLSSCSGYSDSDKEKFKNQINSYLTKEQIKAEQTTSGVCYQILEKGDGPEVKYTDKIVVTYKGTLLNGTVFDQKTEPISFNLRNLIPAWKQILPGLKVGSKLWMITPPDMGYGADEQEKIPSNSILIFEINLLSIE